jgi:hypothetical protein
VDLVKVASQLYRRIFEIVHELSAANTAALQFKLILGLVQKLTLEEDGKILSGV